MNILKSLFGKSESKRSGTLINNGDLPQISPDTEVWLIKNGLERKFGHPFQTKVKVDGYLDEMEYRLVINDYQVDHLKKSHSVWGSACSNVLDLNTAFVTGYWDGLHRARQKLAEGTYLSDFDRESAKDRLDMAVAGSREELIMRAVVEGYI